MCKKTATMTIFRGSKMHQQLIKKIEFAQSRGWSPQWFYDGQNMYIVDMININDNYFEVYLEN